MAYKAMKSIITRGIINNNLDVEDARTKLDVFYAGDRIAETQYQELTGLINDYVANQVEV